MPVFPTPSQIQQTYFQILKSIKPSINTADANSDFVIRGKTISGIVSGMYGDQANVDSDSFISSSNGSALDLRGEDLGIPRNQPTYAISADIQITGINGTVIGIGALTFLYVATNIQYTNTTGGTIAGGILNLQITALIAGEIGNVVAPDTLQIISTPSGVNAIATLIDSIADGSDIETDNSYRARLLARLQNPPSGGNLADYKAWGYAADSSIQLVTIYRWATGLGTVGIYITSGTNNIDYAITNGIPVVRIPSGALLTTVQNYYNNVVPLTDCATVYAPTEIPISVTVNVVLDSGLTLSSVPSDSVNNPLNLTIQQLVQREVSRVIYKNPIGGRIITGYTNGVLAASDIEYNLNVWLSAVIDPVSQTAIGIIPVLTDVFVEQLNPPIDYNIQILGNQLAAPGTILVVLGGI